MSEAQLVEVFSSIQGEGLRLGEMQTFVRFQGCSLRCRWCDTPENFNPKKSFRIEEVPFSKQWREENNPVSVSRLYEVLSSLKNTWVSLTGGEPLEQLDFLKEFLQQKNEYRFLLETGGFLPQALDEIIAHLDCVSMDIKLPSSAKTGEFWGKHQDFLKIAQNAPQFYVKIVLTAQSEKGEIAQALELIQSVNAETPVIFQPASPIRGFQESPSVREMFDFYSLSSKFRMPVRIIPQVHRIIGVS